MHRHRLPSLGKVAGVQQHDMGGGSPIVPAMELGNLQHWLQAVYVNYFVPFAPEKSMCPMLKTSND